MTEKRDEPPAVAPAPAPPPRAAARARQAKGFDTSRRRVVLEILAVAVVVVALGVGAFVGAGALAAWMTPLVPLHVDRTLGEASAAAMLTDDCGDAAAQAYVERLARPLLEAAGPLPFEFEFRVVDDPTVNAYALPGGFVTVHRGLLEAAEGGDEVAGVLAHEIQHALLRHGTRRMLRQMGGGMVLSLLVGGTDLHALSDYAGQLTSLSYDRDQELEADERGVALLVAAGIDPRGLSRFFERLRDEGGPAPPELLSTHPEPARRAQRVREAAAGQTFVELPPPPQQICGRRGPGAR